MSRVFLTKLRIINFGPIKEDEVILEPFTYFVGRNNAGKSHYLRAIETLLSPKAPSVEEIIVLQNEKNKGILIEGYFEGVGRFTPLVSKSNHRQAIEEAIEDGVLKVARNLDPSNSDNTKFGVRKSDGEITNPSGFAANLLKVLPEPISIFATVDTIDELKSRGNTALVKLKKEVLGAFFERLRGETKKALEGIDDLLHSQEEDKRAPELTTFESDLRDELLGEFSDVVPSVEFGLPDEQVVAREMKIFLDDGYRSEVEQKGHGLQRATLLAILRLLARRGQRYTDRPAPLFLIGELETFLHPYAQRQLAEALNRLVDRYQVITSTHSPFIITADFVEGYRRVVKGSQGTKSSMPRLGQIEKVDVGKHLQSRGNMEGLFADRIILVEGKHDEDTYERLLRVFAIPYPPRKHTLFVRTTGKNQLRILRRFYREMGFDDIAVIADLDYLLSSDVKYLFKELGLDSGPVEEFRKHIAWTRDGDPSLDEVLAGLKNNEHPANFDTILSTLRSHRIFVLRHGAPESYYKDFPGRKDGWMLIESRSDLKEADYLENLLRGVLQTGN